MRLRLGILVAAITIGGLAPAAHAAPADLDPTFDADGVAIAPNAGRTSVQSEPIVQADGKVLVAGINGLTGRVFVQRFTSSGAPDPSFGSGGELATALVAPQGRVAVAAAPGGGFHIASPASNGSKVILTRFAAGGSVVSSVTANVPGSLSHPAAADVRPDGSTYVANKFDCGAGAQCFGVLKFKGNGLDATFGGGYVKTKIGGASSPSDIAVVTDANGSERVIVAGSVSASNNANTDTTVVRYLSTGVLDPTFGAAGIQTFDIGGTGEADAATGLVAAASGALTLAGAVGTKGYVARLTSTGALQSSFGTNGVRVGFGPAGNAHRANDIAADDAGRLVVAGQSTDTAAGTTRWFASRLTTTGAFDGDFATGGTRLYEPCANGAGHGATGVTVAPSKRIHLSGACNADGRVAAARLRSVPAFTGAAAFTVTPGAEAAGHQTIRNVAVDPQNVFKLGNLQGSSVRSLALRPNPLSTALRPNPLSAALRPNPIVESALRPNPLGTALRPNPIADEILLSQLPIFGTTWEAVIGGAIDKPISDITLSELLRANPPGLAGVSLADVDLTATPLADVSATALLLSLRPLVDIPAPQGQDWCAYLDEHEPVNCTNGVDPDRDTLIDLELAGDTLSGYYANPVRLVAATRLGTGTDTAAPVARIKLVDLELDLMGVGEIRASAVPGVTNCTSDCDRTLAQLQNDDPSGFSSSDLGTLIARLPAGGPDVPIGDVLRAVFDPLQIPFEDAERQPLLDAADIRSGHLQTYSTSFTVECSQAAGLLAAVGLPDDARIVPGTATLTAGGVPKTIEDEPSKTFEGRPAFDLAPACAGTSSQTLVKLTFQVEPGSKLGPRTASITIWAEAGELHAKAPVTIDDSLDAGNTFDSATPLSENAMITGHITSTGDVDWYSIPAPPTGSKVTFVLSQLPADYDLTVYGASEDLPSIALRPNALRPNPLGPDLVPDATGEPTDPAEVAPDTVQDIALRPNPLEGQVVRTNSIHRSTTTESATVVSRASDQGGALTVAVTGYNGASHVEPYTLRVKVSTPEPPPPCAPQPALSAGSPPSTLPANVPDDTAALILVNQQRLAARYPDEGAAQVMGSLATLAERTDALIVPLDVPETHDEYQALDESPCSVEAANDVVAAINGVVDQIREAGGGLPELKSILIVGGDPIVPQARVADRAVIANETDFADEATFGGLDNAVSRAARLAYMLSDDPYGDFDRSGGLFVPDVALGRLIERPAQIKAQIDAFTAPNGDRVVPTRAFTTGYDFLSDGARATSEALAPAVPAGAAQYLEDTWTAADAAAGVNKPGAAFASVNGHYDPYRALPAAGDALLTASDLTPPSGSVLFTVGCHSGLNFSFAVSNPDATETLKLGDWAQTIAEGGSEYVGNTAYGYGDTEAIAYSERLMADYASQLASHKATTGQALMYAKQMGAARLTSTDAYWQKASMVATYYGIPMYKVGLDGTEGAASSFPTTEQSATRSSTVKTIDIPTFTPHEGGDGTQFWTVGDEDPLVIQRRPIQPKTTVDVTPADGAPVHGAMIEALTTHEETPVKHTIARPVIADSQAEPPGDADAPFFPAQMVGVASEQTASGRKARLTLVAGQARDDIQRFVDSASVRVFRSRSSDFTPPVIQRVDGLVVNNGLSVTVDVIGGDEVGGNVLYRVAGDPVWHTANLAPIAPGRLGGGDRLPVEADRVVEAIVQVLDAAGNTAMSSNKIIGHVFRKAETDPTDPNPPSVRFDPPTPDRGSYYSSPPQIELDRGGHAETEFEYSMDGGPWRPYTGRFTVDQPTEGEHIVRFRGSDGSFVADRFAVDTTGPVVTGEPTSLPNENGWYRGDVTIRWTCADAVSGVATCPADSVITGEGTGLGASASATDRAGNSGSGSVGSIRIDRTPPEITGSRDPAANEDGWHQGPVTVSFDCGDPLSGVAFCSAAQTIDDAQDATVEGTARDRAGNTSTTAVEHVRVDPAPPSVEIRSSSILVGTGASGVATDDTTVKGVSGIKAVTATYTGGLFGSRTETPAVTLTCDEGRRTCEWRSASPGTGFWEVSVTSTDFAGRESAVASGTVNIG